jgi:outer membrane protein assembly factor BamB
VIVRLLAISVAGTLAAAMAINLTPSVVLATSVQPHTVAIGDWPQFQNSPNRKGFNTAENVLSPANIAAMGVAWKATTGNTVFASVAVANGVVYAASADDKLYAFAVGCGSGGATCLPLWTAGTGGVIYSSPVVADGVVYVGSEDHKLYAFDAAGVTGCSGVPKTCTPIWVSVATGGVMDSSPTVVGGVVYVGSNDGKLYAFAVGCSSGAGTCSPLWTGATFGFIAKAPAVANGVVYVGSADGKLYAFDAAGVTGCSGVPVTCLPLWTGTTGGSIWSSPAIDSGVVYVGDNDHKLYAFDAAGVTGCSGSPTTCTPLWTGATGSSIQSSPSVADGVIYVGSDDGRLQAFAAGCASGGGTCTPIWTATTGAGVYSSPAIANGVVYVGSEDGKLYAYAVGCASGGATCSPLWSRATGGAVWSSPAVSNGVVYVGASDSNVYAFAIIPATYHALTPARILDSRDGTGLSGVFSSHVARTFQVTGHGGVPVGATAVTGNLTVTQQSSPGFLYVGPAAADNPTSSTLNFPLGDDRANAVTVALGAGGSLSATYAASTLGPTAHVVFDVTGYFTPDTTGATYHALASSRILDTRDGTGLSGAFGSHVARPFQVTGRGGVPAGATAVTGNLTVTQQTSLGFLYVGPVAMNNPTSSTLNFPMSDDRANAVTVALDGSGQLSATYAAPALGPTAHVIFDVTGYFTADMSGSAFVPLTPGRILDTRDGTGGLSGPFGSHIARGFAVTGHAGVPPSATAVTGNLTVTQQTSLGFLYLGPVAMNNPTSSTLNFPMSDDRANAVTVDLGGGGILSATYAAPTLGQSAHVIFDVTGYFTP